MKRRSFDGYSILVTLIVTLMGIICLLPLLNVLAESLSDNASVGAGAVWFWPKNINLRSYVYVLKRVMFWKSMRISLIRVVLGASINVLICLITAYPLSKPTTRFRRRTLYVWILFFTSLFSGGLIPTYVLVKELGMLDTMWALVLPGSVPVFNVLLMLNFYRAIPDEIEEAAIIDGASQWRILWRLFIPISLPAIATITLFSMVGHWNSWFDGMIYNNRPENYPMSSYLRNLLFQTQIMESGSAASSRELLEISERTLQAAQVFVGILPIMIVYPFLQKYFVKGIMLGSVKG